MSSFMRLARFAVVVSVALAVIVYLAAGSPGGVGEFLSGLLGIFMVVSMGTFIFVRSFRRGIYLYGKPPGLALFTAGLAVVFWPLTLCYWMFGPTPERRAAGRYG